MLGLNPYHRDTLRQEKIRFPVPLETESVLEENPLPLSLEELGPPPMKKSRGNNELGDDHVVGEESDSQSPPMKKSRGNSELEYHPNAEGNVVGLESDSQSPLMKNSQGSNDLGDDDDDGRRIVLFDDSVLEHAENERQHANLYGFDVPLSGGFPVVKYRKGINSVDRYLYHTACYCAKFAVNFHKEREEVSELEFVYLVKFDLEKLAGSMVYYLTFEAIDGDHLIDTYRAKVAFSESKGDRKAKVLLFSGKSGTYVPSEEHGTDLMQEENPDAHSEEEVGSSVRESCRGNKEHYPESLDVNLIHFSENCAFHRQWEYSDGFDADYPPHGFLVGEDYLLVKDLASIRKLDEYLRHTAYYCAKFAVEDHNNNKDEEEKKKLEFVELVKFNVDHMYSDDTPEYYHLTFKAREVGGRVELYQARVEFEETQGKREAEVDMFRKKK